MNPKNESKMFHAALDEWTAMVQTWPAERSRLRKCRNPDEAAFGPSFHVLVGKAAVAGRGNPERLLSIAPLAALVRENDTTRSLAAQMALVGDGGRPAISDLRFRRIIRTEDAADAFPLLRRVIHLLEGRANLHDMAESVYWWNDGTKKKWAFDYYSTLPPEHLKKTS